MAFIVDALEIIKTLMQMNEECEERENGGN